MNQELELMVIGNLISGTLAIIGSFGGVCIGYRLAMRHEYRLEHAKFRAAFAEVLAYFNRADFSPDRKDILERSIEKHETAIIMYEVYISRWKRRRFKRDCETYRQQREYAQSQLKMESILPNEAKAFKDTIEKLLAYAE